MRGYRVLTETSTDQELDKVKVALFLLVAVLHSSSSVCMGGGDSPRRIQFSAAVNNSVAISHKRLPTYLWIFIENNTVKVQLRLENIGWARGGGAHYCRSGEGANGLLYFFFSLVSVFRLLYFNAV